MDKVYVKDLIDNLDCIVEQGISLTHDIEISGVAIDSREVKKGDLFVALTGNNQDGSDFINDAIKMGCACILTSKKIDIDIPIIYCNDVRFVFGQLAKAYRKRFNIPIVAITGSCGKTTTKQMISNILSLSGKTNYTFKNYNNELGVPLTIFNIESLHKYCVVEMGACRVGDIRYLMDIALPTVTCVLNARDVHLDSFNTVENVAIGKGEIYKYLESGKTAIINMDEKFVSLWEGFLTNHKIYKYSVKPQGDIYCQNIQFTDTGSMFNVNYKGKSFKVSLPLLGIHNISNAMAAISMALALDIEPEKIVSGLRDFKNIEGRFQIKMGYNGSTVIDDSYNSNPDAMKAALEVLGKFSNKKILVMADMLELGTNADYYHKAIADFAKESGVTRLLGFGPLTKMTCESFVGLAKHYEDKQQLISDLKDMVDSESTVLIKGSNGMKLSEVAKDLILHD